MQIVIILVIVSIASAVFFFFNKNSTKTKKEDKSQSSVKKTFNIKQSVISKTKSKKKTKKYKNEDFLRDYNFYTMTVIEIASYILIAFVVMFLVGYIFYRNIPMAMLISVISLYYPKIKKRSLIRNQKKDLNLQFVDVLYSISSSLTAGKSVETAFRSCLDDLKVMYVDENTYMIKEIEYIIMRLDVNDPIEDVLIEFKERAHLEDISNFVDIFTLSKRTGGDLVDVIKTTASSIADKIQIMQDIDVMVAQKKFEQKILVVMPVFLVLILSMSCPEYMDPVFNSVSGKVSMTIAIIIFVVSNIISSKIIDIEV